MTEPPKCPVCPRITRDGRPLCNNHLRRVGETVLRRWFAAKKAAAQHPGERVYTERLATVEADMIGNAHEWEHIRDTGQRPFWNPSRERWEDPRNRARDIIWRTIKNHRFGLDPDNDADVADRLAAELYPHEPR